MFWICFWVIFYWLDAGHQITDGASGKRRILPRFESRDASLPIVTNNNDWFTGVVECRPIYRRIDLYEDCCGRSNNSRWRSERRRAAAGLLLPYPTCNFMRWIFRSFEVCFALIYQSRYDKSQISDLNTILGEDENKRIGGIGSFMTACLGLISPAASDV